MTTKQQFRTPGPDSIGARHPDLGTLEQGKPYPVDFPADGKRWLVCDETGKVTQQPNRDPAPPADPPLPVVDTLKPHTTKEKK